MDRERTVAEIIRRMMEYNRQDPKRINHALKVYAYAKTLGLLEGLQEEGQLVLEAAAVLHDIGIHEAQRQYNSDAGRYQELEGPIVARKLLKDGILEEAVLDRVCYLIGHHHSYKKVDDAVFQMLVEADFMVNAEEMDMDKHARQTINQKYIRTETGKWMFHLLRKESVEEKK
ncbi:HD domain-containing protein [Anaerotalea alkaliphila]|uniref:HD domain-containing protein n=1 Tax=Anaerotalea alkaliphila TaxID=2662126 RepID=A0A7X5KNU8_9FIRM|nr:HD domain-containing protein [Anaerotalea alkaliphila]NDL67127.1 HD domain-containing protein [Anaerotalea alkaliphila]